MNKILLIINLVLSLYGTSPIFTTCDAMPEDRAGQVYVTVDYGMCLDEYGNGMLYGYSDEYNYISYARTEAKPGDTVYTFCVYNPENNYCDDIIYRFDVIVNEFTDNIFNTENIIEYTVNNGSLQLYFSDGTGYYLEMK